MAIFRYRPLAAASVVLILVAAFLFRLPTWSAFCLIGLFSLLIGFIGFYAYKKGMTPRRFLCLLLCCGALIGVCRALPQRVAADRAETFVGREIEARLRIEEVIAVYPYAEQARVRVLSVDSETLRFKAVFQCDSGADLHAGDMLVCRVGVTSLEAAERYTGEAGTWRGDGALIFLTAADAPTIETSGKTDLRQRIADFGLLLAGRVRERIGGEEGDLTGALLFGDRTPLDNTTRRDFRRVGISHLLAISGLHIGILAAAIDRFLLLFRMNKTARGAVVLVLMGFYLLLTGCGFSILRAVLMAAGLYLCYLLRGDSDSFTTLCFTGAVIVLLMPYAVFSVSYQLTMCATFGILAFEEAHSALITHLPHAEKGIGKWLCRGLRALVTSVSISLCVSFLVLPVCFFSFDSFSWLTPFSNLVTVPLAAALLIFGVLAMLPFGLAAYPAKGCAGLILKFVAVFSKARCLLSLKLTFVPFLLIVSMIGCFIFLLIPLKKRKWLAYLPVVLFAVGFCLGSFVNTAVTRNTLTAVYLHHGKNDGLLLCGQNKAMIVDLSNGSAARLRDDFEAASDLGATEVEVLCYTHYHAAMPDAFADFADREIVRAVWCPEATTNEERQVAVALLGEAAKRDIPVTIYHRQTPLVVFKDGTMTVSSLLYENRSVEPAFHLTVSFGTSTLTVASAAESEYLRHAGGGAQPGADIVILTAHGPVPHEAVTVPESTGCLVIPDDKTLALLDAAPDTMYIDRPDLYVFKIKK